MTNYSNTVETEKFYFYWQIIERLCDEAVAEMYEALEEDISDKGSSSIYLGCLSSEDIDAISNVFERFSARYWLADEIRINPSSKYELWVTAESEYGHQYALTWGFSRVSEEG